METNEARVQRLLDQLESLDGLEKLNKMIEILHNERTAGLRIASNIVNTEYKKAMHRANHENNY